MEDHITHILQNWNEQARDLTVRVLIHYSNICTDVRTTDDRIDNSFNLQNIIDDGINARNIANQLLENPNPEIILRNQNTVNSAFEVSFTP